MVIRNQKLLKAVQILLTEEQYETLTNQAYEQGFMNIQHMVKATFNLGKAHTKILQSVIRNVMENPIGTQGKLRNLVGFSYWDTLTRSEQVYCGYQFRKAVSAGEVPGIQKAGHSSGIAVYKRIDICN